VKRKTPQSVASTERMVDYDRNSYMQDQMVRSRTEWLRADVYEASLSDPETYARLYAGYIRGFGESTLRMHVFDPSAKSAVEVDTLTEEFFGRLTRYYQAGPGRHASETMIMTLVLRRR